MKGWPLETGYNFSKIIADITREKLRDLF